MEEKNRSRNKYKICAEVVDRENGAQSYDNIRMVRVISKDHNLLIMEDYMPVIGEITGKVELIMDDKIIPFSSVHGFYMHKKNRFSLLIENHEGIVPTPVK